MFGECLCGFLLVRPSYIMLRVLGADMDRLPGSVFHDIQTGKAYPCSTNDRWPAATTEISSGDAVMEAVSDAVRLADAAEVMSS
jgi:hypothetical protein